MILSENKVGDRIVRMRERERERVNKRRMFTVETAVKIKLVRECVRENKMLSFLWNQSIFPSFIYSSLRNKKKEMSKITENIYIYTYIYNFYFLFIFLFMYMLEKARVWQQ